MTIIIIINTTTTTTIIMVSTTTVTIILAATAHVIKEPNVSVLVCVYLRPTLFGCLCSLSSTDIFAYQMVVFYCFRWSST